MTETTTEWAVHWPEDTGDGIEPHRDETEARRIADMWAHAGAVLARRTVTHGEWTT